MTKETKQKHSLIKNNFYSWIHLKDNLKIDILVVYLGLFNNVSLSF